MATTITPTQSPAPSAASPARGRVKLALERVSKWFTVRRGRTIEAVRDVSFHVPEYETCVLLGPSGCGKSTILRMIAGLETVSDGVIRLDGRPVEGPGRDRGMVFQSYTSFPWLTVKRNVEYGMKLNGIPRGQRDAQSRYFLDLVGLGEFADHYPGQLSGGMRQRVAIGRTLANQPAVLLMDEPFGALDAETRWQMQELLAHVSQKHRMTVLMVTHDIEKAIFLADRIVFLSARPGRIDEVIEPGFKTGGRWLQKEQMLEESGFTELKNHLTRKMREVVEATGGFGGTADRAAAPQAGGMA